MSVKQMLQYWKQKQTHQNTQGPEQETEENSKEDSVLLTRRRLLWTKPEYGAGNNIKTDKTEPDQTTRREMTETEAPDPVLLTVTPIDKTKTIPNQKHYPNQTQNQPQPEPNPLKPSKPTKPPPLKPPRLILKPPINPHQTRPVPNPNPTQYTLKYKNLTNQTQPQPDYQTRQSQIGQNQTQVTRKSKRKASLEGRKETPEKKLKQESLKEILARKAKERETRRKEIAAAETGLNQNTKLVTFSCSRELARGTRKWVEQLCQGHRELG